MDRDWNKTDGSLGNSQKRKLCSKFKTHFNNLHYRLHTMGPKLPAILISLDCDDSVKPPHFPPPGRDTHNKQPMTSARVTARGCSSPPQEQHRTRRSNGSLLPRG